MTVDLHQDQLDSLLYHLDALQDCIRSAKSIPFSGGLLVEEESVIQAMKGLWAVASKIKKQQHPYQESDSRKRSDQTAVNACHFKAKEILDQTKPKSASARNDIDAERGSMLSDGFTEPPTTRFDLKRDNPLAIPETRESPATPSISKAGRLLATYVMCHQVETDTKALQSAVLDLIPELHDIHAPLRDLVSREGFRDLATAMQPARKAAALMNLFCELSRIYQPQVIGAMKSFTAGFHAQILDSRGQQDQYDNSAADTNDSQESGDGFKPPRGILNA